MFKNPMFSVIFLLIASLFTQGCGTQFEANSVAASSVSVNIGNNHGVHGKQKIEYQAHYANRIYMYNLFEDVFGPSMQKKITKQIGWATADMGSAFSPYQFVAVGDNECNNNPKTYYQCKTKIDNLKADPVFSGSTTREGRRISACHHGADNDSSLLFAIKKIDATATETSLPAGTPENFHKAIQLFYRGKPAPGVGVIDALDIAFKKQTEPLEAWRNVILGICLSPHWQVL